MNLVDVIGFEIICNSGVPDCGPATVTSLTILPDAGFETMRLTTMLVDSPTKGATPIFNGNVEVGISAGAFISAGLAQSGPILIETDQQNLLIKSGIGDVSGSKILFGFGNLVDGIAKVFPKKPVIEARLMENIYTIIGQPLKSIIDAKRREEEKATS